MTRPDTLPPATGCATMQEVSRPLVVVIGSVNMDITVHADRLPGRGETVTGGNALRGGGGKGANAAVAAARAGAEVRLGAAGGGPGGGTRSGAPRRWRACGATASTSAASRRCPPSRPGRR